MDDRHDIDLPRFVRPIGVLDWGNGDTTDGIARLDPFGGILAAGVSIDRGPPAHCQHLTLERIIRRALATTDQGGSPRQTDPTSISESITSKSGGTAAAGADSEPRVRDLLQESTTGQRVRRGDRRVGGRSIESPRLVSDAESSGHSGGDTRRSRSTETDGPTNRGPSKSTDGSRDSPGAADSSPDPSAPSGSSGSGLEPNGSPAPSGSDGLTDSIESSHHQSMSSATDTPREWSKSADSTPNRSAGSIDSPSDSGTAPERARISRTVTDIAPLADRSDSRWADDWRTDRGVDLSVPTAPLGAPAAIETEGGRPSGAATDPLGPARSGAGQHGGQRPIGGSRSGPALIVPPDRAPTEVASSDGTRGERDSGQGSSARTAASGRRGAPTPADRTPTAGPSPAVERREASETAADSLLTDDGRIDDRVFDRVYRKLTRKLERDRRLEGH